MNAYLYICCIVDLARLIIPIFELLARSSSVAVDNKVQELDATVHLYGVNQMHVAYPTCTAPQCTAPSALLKNNGYTAQPERLEKDMAGELLHPWTLAGNHITYYMKVYR